MNEDLPLRPAVRALAEYSEMMDGPTLESIECGYSHRMAFFRTLLEKYGSRFAERADHILRLSPDVHVLLFSDTTAGRLQQKKTKYVDVEDLDYVIAQVSEDVDREVRQRLAAAGLIDGERQYFPAAQRYVDLVKADRSDLVKAAWGERILRFGAGVRNTLEEKHRPRFAERTEEILHLSPEYHRVIGSSTTLKQCESRWEQYREDIPDLDAVVSQISLDVDVMVQEKLRRGGLLPLLPGVECFQRLKHEDAEALLDVIGIDPPFYTRVCKVLDTKFKKRFQNDADEIYMLSPEAHVVAGGTVGVINMRTAWAKWEETVPDLANVVREVSYIIDYGVQRALNAAGLLKFPKGMEPVMSHLVV